MGTELDRILGRPMSRRDVLRLAVVVGGTSLVAACGSSGEQAAAPPPPLARPPVEQEPGHLNIIEYVGYEVPDLWKPYAEMFPGDKPTFTLIGSDDEATAKARLGAGADLGHPCVGVIQDWIKLGVVQPWDTSLISSFPDLNPGLVQAGQIDGQQYFVPLDWGFISAMYRSDKVDLGGEESWSLLFDDRYKGKIAWYDSSQDMLAITGYYLGFPKPFEMTDDELAQAKKFLVEKKKKNVKFIWSSQTDMEATYAGGDVWITYAWPSSWVNMQKQHLQVGYLKPKEGRLAFLCGMMLMKNTKNYFHAHDYANAWASPETALWLLQNYAYGHSNTKIDLTKADPKLVEAFQLKDPASIAEPAVHVLRYIPRRHAYTKVWSEVKAA